MITKIDPVTEDFLKEFGLSDREISLYFSLLKTGPNTIMNLSRETGIKRSTTHNNVEELMKKGLVSQTNYGERRMVVAESPSKLRLLLDQKKYKVKKMESSLNDVVDQISKYLPTKEAEKGADVKYYEGIEGFRDACNRSLDFATDEVLFISNPEEWQKVFTAEYEDTYYIPKRLEKDLKARTLLVDNDASRKIGTQDSKLSRESRILPKGFDFKVTTIIYPGEVSIMLSSEPYTAILIGSKEIYETYKNLFEELWKISK